MSDFSWESFSGGEDRPDETGGQYLVCDTGGVRQAMPVSDINAVVVPDAYAQVPGAPDHLVGVLEHRGGLVPVVSVRRIFGMELPREEIAASLRSGRELVVVIETGKGLVGVRVDRIENIVRPEGTTRRPELLKNLRAVKDYVLLEDGAVIGVLDAQFLADFADALPPNPAEALPPEPLDPGDGGEDAGGGEDAPAPLDAVEGDRDERLVDVEVQRLEGGVAADHDGAAEDADAEEPPEPAPLPAQEPPAEKPHQPLDDGGRTRIQYIASREV